MKVYSVIVSTIALILAILAFIFSMMHYYYLPQRLDHAYLEKLKKVVKVYGNNDINGLLLTLGHYGRGKNNKNLIIFSSKSRLDKQDGQPSIMLNNIIKPLESVELGFYHYGPTLVSDNSIFEFWLGNSHDNSASVSILNKSGNADSTTRLELRYPGDAGALVFDSNHKLKEKHVSRIWQTNKKRKLLFDVPVIKRQAKY